MFSDSIAKVCLMLYLLTVIPSSSGQLLALGLRFRFGHLIAGGQTTAPNSSVCLGPLGCFNNGPPFYDDILRPMSLLPLPRKYLDVKFQLFTRKNKKDFQEIWAEKIDELKASNFDPEVPTKVVIHGLMDAVTYKSWLQLLKDELLIRSSYNVILVDWARANRLPYEQAIGNGRAVGAEVALLVNSIIENLGGQPEMFHIIGHSLGCHVSGYAGERIKNLGRITGLDPAGPIFSGAPNEVRLDRTDANFVDVIHTDAGLTILTGLGTIDPIGHVDFYPNSGKQQPGCKDRRMFKRDASFNTGSKNSGTSAATPLGRNRRITRGYRHFLACDHLRAAELFIASINNPGCQMVSSECYDYNNYLKGRCHDCGVNGTRCSVLGIDADQYYTKEKLGKTYYLKTSGEYPFCLHQSHVTVSLDKTNTSWTWGQGHVVIEGENMNVKTSLGTISQLFSPGKNYTYMVSSAINLGPIEDIVFHWEGGHYKPRSYRASTTTTTTTTKSPDDKETTNLNGTSSTPPPLVAATEENPAIYVKGIRISPMQIKQQLLEEQGTTSGGTSEQFLCSEDPKQPLYPMEELRVTSQKC